MSSNEIAIQVTNLSKCYQIYARPTDRLKQFFVPKLQQEGSDHAGTDLIRTDHKRGNGRYYWTKWCREVDFAADYLRHTNPLRWRCTC